MASLNQSSVDAALALVANTPALIPYGHHHGSIAPMGDVVMRNLGAMHETLLGAIAQMITVHDAQPKLSDLKQASIDMIRTGLIFESLSDEVVEAFVAAKLPALSGYSNLSYRWLLKCLPAHSLFALAITGSHPAVTMAILCSRIETGAWNFACRDFGFDMDEFCADVRPVLEDELDRRGWASNDVIHACSMYPNGPFTNGFSAGNNLRSATPTTTTPTTTTTSTQGVTMTNATTASIASLSIANAVNGLKPELRTLIDGMLTQFGINATIQSLATNASMADSLANTLASDADAYEAALTDLRTKLAAKANMPTTMAMPSTTGTIPDGSMSTVSVDTIFSQLKGVSLSVPTFTWEHKHPDVPEINEDYIFRKEMLVKTLSCLVKGENLWLTGHTGSGKTTFIEQIAARLGWPVARVAFDSNVDRSEMVGRMQLDGDGKGGTVSRWLPGILEIATSRGYIMLCDELDAGHPNALYTLQPILEYKGLTLLEDGGRVVNRGCMARTAATGNTAGNGDPSGLYPACRILSAATLDRFTTFINVPYMSTDEEAKLINSSVPGLKAALVNKMVKFGAELRQAFVTGQTPISYSPRRSVAFAREVSDLMDMGYKDETVALTAAFRSKLYDAASEEFRQRITEIANACFGGIDPTKTLD